MSSDNWSGFSDEDITRIKSNVSENSGPLQVKEAALKDVKPRGLFNNSKLRDFSESEQDFDKHLHISITSQSRTFHTPTATLENSYNNSDKCTKSTEEISDVTSMSKETKESSTEDKMSNSTSSLHELEVFEIRQKKIEAENARRRALINKAITDKKMQTQAEAMKLAKITQELNRLDSILSEDVSILRNYIEKASLEFSEAEKRYLRAERDFIEAKLFLFEKMQRKEQLTEHLCAIIEQNENRKAAKLAELMRQLEMEVAVGAGDGGDSEHLILSKFCLLNDEAYHCCQTLRPSSPPDHPPPSPDEPCTCGGDPDGRNGGTHSDPEESGDSGTKGDS